MLLLNPEIFGVRSHQKVSDIEKLKLFLGEHAPDPPSLRKSMSSIIFLANKTAFEVLM